MTRVLKGSFIHYFLFFLLEDLGVKKSPLCNFAMDLIKLGDKVTLGFFFTVLLFDILGVVDDPHEFAGLGCFGIYIACYFFIKLSVSNHFSTYQYNSYFPIPRVLSSFLMYHP